MAQANLGYGAGHNTDECPFFRSSVQFWDFRLARVQVHFHESMAIGSCLR
jgi:hypothetical protein